MTDEISAREQAPPPAAHRAENGVVHYSCRRVESQQRLSPDQSGRPRFGRRGDVVMAPSIVTDPGSPIEFTRAERECGTAKTVTLMWSTGVPLDYGEVFYRVNGGPEVRFDDPTDLLQSSKVFSCLKFRDKIEFSLRSSFTHHELATLTVSTADDPATSIDMYGVLNRRRIRMDRWLSAPTW
jgi:hypothetical protein